MHGQFDKLQHLCACSCRAHFNCFPCCSAACKFPSGQIPVISISADIFSGLAITQRKNQCNNNHLKLLFLLLPLCVVYRYAYITHLAQCVCFARGNTLTFVTFVPCLENTEWPDKSGDEGWKLTASVLLWNRNSGLTRRWLWRAETRPAPERIVVASSWRLCVHALGPSVFQTTCPYKKVQPRLESPEYKATFYGRGQDRVKPLAAGRK